MNRAERLHAVTMEELRLPALKPTMADTCAWEAWLWTMKPLDDTPGGPLTPADVRAVIRLRWVQKEKNGARWAMTLQSILRDPELFRDQVLELRRPKRPRPPVQRVERQRPDGSRVEGIRDPAAADPPPMDEQTRRFVEELEHFKRRKQREAKV